MNFTAKTQISTIVVALIFSFYSSFANAAPVAPTVRAPGASPSAPRQTAAVPANTTSANTPPTGTTQPVKTNSVPVSVQPQAEQTQPTPASTVQIKKETVSPNGSDTTAAQPVKTQNAPIIIKPNATTAPVTKSTTEAVKPGPTKKQNTAVVPGHPFRIQNKEENYNSLLSKTATRKLDAALADMIGGYGEKVPGLAVIVFKDGKEVYRNMMGNRFLSPRNKNWNLPVTSDSRFRVASISKIFTATGYMQLVEEGKISLDEDVSRYLGFTLRNPGYPNKAITSRMLLSHTSSIRDYPTPYVPKLPALISAIAI